MKTTKQLRENIKFYRSQIAQYASGPNNIRRLNNMNWVRYRITAIEPKILFQSAEDENKIDYTYMHNIDVVYEYVNQFQDRPTKHQLNTDDIIQMHKMFVQNTNLQFIGGKYRRDDKVLNIYLDDGSRMHATDTPSIEYEITDIVHRANTGRSSIMDRAFNLHYEIIALQPFEDCNKRIARATMNLFLVLNKMPMIFFDNKKDKVGYLDAFSARANKRNNEYTEYMLHVTERSYRSILQNIKHSKIR